MTNFSASTLSVLEGDVKRLCMFHFTSAVLPELRKFKVHLEGQGMQIENRLERRQDLDHFRAQLLIEYPSSSLSVLDFCYHFTRQCLIVSGFIGEKACEDSYKFDLTDLNEVTQVEIYEIIETFVTSAFNEFSLCEFVTETVDEEA